MTAALAPVPPRDRGLWLAAVVIALTVHAAGLALALRLTPSAPPPPVETRVSVEEIRMATSTPRAAPAILSAEPAADAPVAVAPAASPAASSPARPAALTPAEVVTAEAALPAASADLPALAATSAAAPVTVATTSAPRVLPAATALPTTASALPQLSATDAPDPIAAAPAERSAAPAPVDALTATATPRLSAQAAVDPAFAAEASARTLPGAVTPATPADGALRIAGQPVTGQPAQATPAPTPSATAPAASVLSTTAVRAPQVSTLPAVQAPSPAAAAPLRIAPQAAVTSLSPRPDPIPARPAPAQTSPARPAPSDTSPERLAALAPAPQQAPAMQPVPTPGPDPSTAPAPDAPPTDAPAPETDITPAERDGYRAILDYLATQDTGPCFAALPALGQETGALTLDAFGESAARLDGFRAGMEAATGLSPATLPGTYLKPISPAQCAALDFLRDAARYPAFGLYFDLPVRVIASGATLSARIHNTSGQVLHLVLIDDEGLVQTLDGFLRFTRGAGQFAIPMTFQGGPIVTQQLLLAIASPVPLETVRRASGQEAAPFFATLREELTTRGLTPDMAMVAFSVE